jgi:hypothetical protein
MKLLIASLATLLSLCRVVQAAHNTIATDSRCYESGEAIAIRFTMVKPGLNDWINILPAHLANSEVNDDYEEGMWLSTCGYKDTFCNLGRGTVKFDFESQSLFDLEPGRYNAYLFQAEDEYSVAKSTTFKVNPKGVTCDSKCQDTAFSTESSYTLGDEIKVVFDNCDPEPDDWVAIYPDAVDPDDLGEPISWMWSCGNQKCRGKNPTNVVSFESFLQPGKYKAVLAKRHHLGPYAAKARSESFEVKSWPKTFPDASKGINKSVKAKSWQSWPKTICQDSIRISSSCYVQSEEIAYDYNSCMPRDDDWIGFYHTEIVHNDFSKPDIFFSSCGEDSCQGRIGAGLQEKFLHAHHWPLAPGEYRVAAFHENKDETVFPFAETKFVVKAMGESCSQETNRNLRSRE